MDIEDLDLAVGGVGPVFDGDPAKDMHFNSTAYRIVLGVVRMVGRECADLPKPLQ